MSKCGGEPLLSFGGAHKSFQVPQTFGGIDGNTTVVSGCRLCGPHSSSLFDVPL